MRDFGFAFNHRNFSDRILLTEIISDHTSGDASTKDSDYEGHSVKVTTLYLCSSILAERSPFFYKLFDNGMRESCQSHFTLRINASEEAALIDLLKFMYCNTLSATTLPDLLDVLMVADKFDVASCVKYCIEHLRKMPMLLEYALSFFELPSSVLVTKDLQPLTGATKEYIATSYKKITKFQEQEKVLPLSAIEVVVGIDDIRKQGGSENAVFEFVLKWARAYYPKLEERRETLTKRLTQLIWFPSMTCSKLNEALHCPDFNHEQVYNLVLETLFFKIKKVSYNPPHIHASETLESCNCDCGNVRRINKHRPLLMEQFEFPRPRCIVYFDLKKEECANIFQYGNKYFSRPFLLGGRWFFLSVQRVKNQKSLFQFAAFVYKTKESGTCTLDYEFSALRKSSKMFERKFKNQVASHDWPGASPQVGGH